MNNKCTGFTPELFETAVLRNEAQRAYHSAFQAAMEQVEPLDEAVFWKMMSSLSNCVSTDLNRKRGNTCDAVMAACHEFMRSRLFDAKHRSPIWEREQQRASWAQVQLYTWEMLCAFTVRYGKVTDEMHRIFRDMPGLDHGGDSFGDLCEAILLAGEKIVTGLRDGDIATWRQLEKAMDSNPDAKHILWGETYVHMRLTESLENFFLIVAADLNKGDEDD